MNRMALMCLMLALACTQEPAADELRHYPLDTLDDVIGRSHVSVDSTTVDEGAASLRVEAASPTTVLLFETGDIEVENATLIYRARLRTEGLEGQAYLEMWASIPGRGESFSRGLETPLTGTNEWTTQEIPFFLEAGQNPDNVKLNLVVDGTGTVWIDDVRLIVGSR